MLVLSRRVGERVVIAGNIGITILSVQGKRIRLGITAPEGVPVLREELWLRIEDELHGPSEPAASIATTHPNNEHLTNGHLTNGHLTNGHLTNGHLNNGHLNNGHLTNGHQTHGDCSEGAPQTSLSPLVPSQGCLNGHSNSQPN